MQGAEGYEQCNKNELISAPPQKTKTVQGITICGFRKQRARINQPRPSDANLKRVLAACQLCARSSHPITTTLIGSPSGQYIVTRIELMARAKSCGVRASHPGIRLGLVIMRA